MQHTHTHTHIKKHDQPARSLCQTKSASSPLKQTKTKNTSRRRTNFQPSGFRGFGPSQPTTLGGSYCGSQRVPCHAHASAFAMALPEVLEEELEILRALWIPIGSIDVPDNSDGCGAQNRFG